MESLPILNVLDDGFALRADNGFHPMFRRAYGPALRFSDRSSVSFTRVDGGIIIRGPSGIDTVYKLVTVEQLLLWDKEHAGTPTPTARVQNVMHSKRKTKKRISKKRNSKKRTSKKKGASKNMSKQTKPTEEERKAQSAKDIAANVQRKQEAKTIAAKQVEDHRQVQKTRSAVKPRRKRLSRPW